jgi:hypothetical protein
MPLLWFHICAKDVFIADSSGTEVDDLAAAHEYALKIIQIQDQSFATKNGSHQRTLQFTGSASDVVEGVALALTRQELEQADEYEPDDYRRVQIQLRSGLDAWVYLHNGQ